MSVLVVAGVLASCSGSGSESASTQPSATPSAGGQAGAAQPDIIAKTNIRLGKNWGPLESYAGQTFRWVGDSALVLLSGPARHQTIAVDLEPGPGIQSLPMKLRIETADGTSVRDVPGRLTIAVPHPGDEFSLSVLNGGKTIASDPRILNFRVFRIAPGTVSRAPLAAAVAAPPIVTTSNWGPLEHFGGKTFQWIDNDAVFTVPPGGKRTLTIALEGGPGLGAAPSMLEVLANEHTIAKRRVAAHPSSISVLLPPGTSTVRLHIEGGGQHVSGDPRILNFRIFHIAVAQS